MSSFKEQADMIALQVYNHLLPILQGVGASGPSIIAALGGLDASISLSYDTNGAPATLARLWGGTVQYAHFTTDGNGRIDYFSGWS